MEMEISKKLHTLRATLSENGNTINFRNKGNEVEIIVCGKNYRPLFTMTATITQLQQMVNLLAAWEQRKVEPDAD